MNKYSKWNYHKIGQTSFVNHNRNHPHRNLFVDWVINNASSVIEIGPGELIEYQDIRKQKDIEYTIVDVSDVYVDYCSKHFPEIKIIQSSIEDLKTRLRFDVVYAASLLEHMRDIKLALRNMIKLADRFHFVMFKWSYEGNLQSYYKKKKKYWSTKFNIWKLLDEISKLGNIESTQLVCRNGNIRDFEEYSQGKVGEHRTGDYLVIRGKKG